MQECAAICCPNLLPPKRAATCELQAAATVRFSHARLRLMSTDTPASLPHVPARLPALPTELLFLVLGFVPRRQWAGVGTVCRGWQRATCDPRAWARVCVQDLVSGAPSLCPHACAPRELQATQEAHQRACCAALRWAVRRASAAALTELSLAGCRGLCDEDAASMLVPIIGPALRVLVLADCRALTDEGVARLLRRAPGLRVLDLRDAIRLTDATLACAARCCPQLRQLDVCGMHFVTDAGVRSVAGARLPLEAVSLWGCHRVTTEGVAWLVEQCPHLASLNLRYCHNLTDSAVEAAARSCPQLRALNLRYVYKLSDAAVLALCHLQALEELNISQCANVTDAALLDLADRFRDSLRVLQLRDCSRLSVPCLAEAVAGLRRLRLLDVRGCGVACVDELLQRVPAARRPEVITRLAIVL